VNERVYYSEEARRNAQRQQMIVAMAVAGVSLGLGAIIALLLAPDSGENIRDEIRNQLDELLERGSTATRDAVNNMGHQAQDVREQVEDRIKSANK